MEFAVCLKFAGPEMIPFQGWGSGWSRVGNGESEFTFFFGI